MAVYKWILLAISTILIGCTGRTELAELAIQRGKMDEAAHHLRQFLGDYPHDVLALRRLAQVECYELGEFDSCALRAETVLWMIPIDSTAIQLGTYAYTMIANEAGVAEDAARVKGAMRRVSEIYEQAADWNYKQWNYVTAEQQYRQVLRLNPNAIRSYLRLGITFWAQRMWHEPAKDSALVWFKRAERLDPDNEDALIDQIAVYRETDRVAEGLDVAKRLALLRARLYPDSSFETKAPKRGQYTLNYEGDRDMITDSPIFYADTTQSDAADTSASSANGPE